MNDVIIIANPSSGSEEAEKYAQLAKDKLTDNGRHVTIHLTESIDDLAQTAQKATEDRYKTVVLMGGDGTVSNYCQSIKDYDNKPELAILPGGTVNNVARALGINPNIEEAIEALPSLVSRQIDVGLVNDQVFVSLLSAGTIPESVFEVSSEDKEKMGPLAYLAQGVQALSTQEEYHFNITTADKSEELKLNLFMIGMSDTAVGIPNFFEGASYNDGLIHFIGVKSSTFAQQLTSFAQRIFNREDESDNTIFSIDTDGMTIELLNSANESEHFIVKDGDKGPSFPLHIEVLPQWLTVLVPADGDN
ncbi:diacylglycerol/lipid kinase family protein [Aerococcaceae bacterium WGS1372]